MNTSQLRIGVIFGGVSVEHEVSVISALQAAAAMDRRHYLPIPIYWSKSGTWLTGDTLLDVTAYEDLKAIEKAGTAVVPARLDDGNVVLVERDRQSWWKKPRQFPIDVLFIGLHGGAGEDGSLQGLCETLNLPYTGSTVFGSALGMDKVVSKMVCRDQGIPVVDYVTLREKDWAGYEDEWLQHCETKLSYPVVVKPARLGSSVGIQRADDRDALDAAIEDALRYDEKVIVEHGIDPIREINCSVLGDPNHAQASVLEEPVRTKGETLLTFEEKYQRETDGGSKAGGSKTETSGAGMASLDRIIPAPLSPERTQQIQDMAVRVFQLFECAGVSRIDFMIDEATDQLYFNEINTIPGSFSFYLWKPSGVPFQDLVHRMIEIALSRHRLKNSRIRSYDTNLLSTHSLKGIKGAKG